jgi:hypothetical protein
MAALRTLMMLFGALAVLMLGAVTPAGAAEPSCHETSSHQASGAPTPASDLELPMKAMICCSACLTPPGAPTAAQVRLRVVRPSVIRPADLPRGETPSPDPKPPRAEAA